MRVTLIFWGQISTQATESSQLDKAFKSQSFLKKFSSRKTSSPTWRLLDDLNPISPHEAIGDPVEVSTVNGNWEAAQIFPSYLKPEVFPTDTTMSSRAQWFYREPEVVQLEKGGHKIVKYRTKAADTTWPNGEFTLPKIEKQGRNTWSGEKQTSGVGKTLVIAPAERIPAANIPIEAKLDGGDKDYAVSVSNHDAIPVGFARYLDQTNDASLSCVNNKVSEHCINTSCPMDMPITTLVIRNARFEKVTLLSKTANNFYKVRVNIPGDHFNGVDSIDCSNLGCTLDKPCYHAEKNVCSRAKMMRKQDMFGDLDGHMTCGKYWQACRLVAQTVNKGAVKYQGKYCM